MPVRTHYAIAAQPHIYASKSLRKNAFEGKGVGGLFEDTQLTVSAVDDVVNNAASTLSFEARHAMKLVAILIIVKKKQKENMRKIIFRETVKI